MLETQSLIRMKRTSFLGVIFGLPFLSFLQVKNRPVKPVDALDSILSQLALEFGVQIKSCTGKGQRHERTIKACKLPEKFENADCWLCLETQTVQSVPIREEYELEHYTRIELDVRKYNPITERTQASLSKFIASGGSGCSGDGGFAMYLNIRTYTLRDTGETKLVSVDVEIRRHYYCENQMHPLHRRVTSLFEEMTLDYT